MAERRAYTAREKLRAIERELKYRIHVYPRRVHEGKMTQRQADREISVLEEIASDYVALMHRDDRKLAKATQNEPRPNEVSGR